MTQDSTISPQRFDTVLDPENSREDIVLSSPTQTDPVTPRISSLHYHSLMAKLAEVVQSYVKGKKKLVEKDLTMAMSEVERIYRVSPIHLQRDEVPTMATWLRDQQYPWIPMQRYLATHAVHFLRLTIARSFFTRWMQRQPDPDRSHARALDAARTIVDEKRRRVPLAYQRSW